MNNRYRRPSIDASYTTKSRDSEQTSVYARYSEQCLKIAKNSEKILNITENSEQILNIAENSESFFLNQYILLHFHQILTNYRKGSEKGNFTNYFV